MATKTKTAKKKPVPQVISIASAETLRLEIKVFSGEKELLVRTTNNSTPAEMLRSIETLLLEIKEKLQEQPAHTV